jgi:hypothetical protein
MTRSRIAVHSLLLLVFLACGGCVTGQRKLDLEVPTAQKIVNGSRGTVSIAPVVDKRHFENYPDDPSTPSIDGNVNGLSAAAKSKMIGRQRNMFGKAMGDISLAGQTVNSQARALVAEALKRRGYTVTDAKSNNNVDVTLDKFWAWFTPGFWAVDFEADVQADMEVSLNGRAGHGKNSGQVASDANWQLAFSRAYEDFLHNLDGILQALEEDTGLTLSP